MTTSSPLLARRRLLIRSVLLASMLLVPATSAAAEETPDDVHLEQVANGSLVEGTRIRVAGKYQERIDDRLVLYDCTVPFRVAGVDLAGQLRELTPRRDNLVIVGTVRGTDEERWVDVERLETGANDLEFLTARLAAVPADAPDRHERLLEIARDIVRVNERWPDPALLPLARRAVRMSEAARLSSPRPPSVEDDLDFAQRVEAIIADRDNLIEILTAAIARHPDDERLAARLRALDCRPYQGSWIAHEEFKRREGLELVGERWLTPDEKHLADTMAELEPSADTELLVLRRRTDREYALIAESGRVETGMSPQEVRLAIGFPNRVRRVVFAGGEFAQWRYDDGYYYFLEETLVQTPASRRKE